MINRIINIEENPRREGPSASTDYSTELSEQQQSLCPCGMMWGM
jgi:hypothetical protein